LYYVTVLLDSEPKGEGVGFSKKSAEQAAAENACALLFSDIT
jgi:dsRNA-specific ribonuclease